MEQSIVPVIEEELAAALEQESPDIEGDGRNNPNVGLYDTEINHMMRRYTPFQGAIAINELDKIRINKTKAFGFILNTKARNDQGVGHWVACFIDPIHEKTVEYYDSFAESPSPEFSKGVKIIIDKINPSYYLKFKINKIKEQDDRSVSCGWHAMRFLINRMNHIPFKECTGYSDIRRAEKKVKKMKKKYGKFGYI